MVFRAYPLNSAFMGVSILGFILSAIYLPETNPSWAFTLCLFFVIMFVAAMITMSRQEAWDKESLRELHINKKR